MNFTSRWGYIVWDSFSSSLDKNLVSGFGMALRFGFGLGCGVQVLFGLGVGLGDCVHIVSPFFMPCSTPTDCIFHSYKETKLFLAA